MQAHNHPEPTGPRGGPADVFLIVGLPGAGKTTRAKELESTASALRLTPDEWQIALFGNHDLLLDKRDVLEGKLTGASAPGSRRPGQTWHQSEVDLMQWRAQFQAPDDEELRGSRIPPVPSEDATWSDWAAQRWPSLPDPYAPTATGSPRPDQP